MTTITVIGNLAQQVELAYTRSGKPVAELVVLENRRQQDESGEWTDGIPNRFVAKAYGALAEQVAASVTTGDRVSVTGKIRTEQWDDKESGQKRSRQIVVADDVAVSLKWATATVQRVRREH